MKKLGLDKRERKFVAGVAEGKSVIRAAKCAGYSKSTAEKKAFAILRLPLVQSEVTKALEACNVKFTDIMRPIEDARKANKKYVNPNVGMMMARTFADRTIRLATADRAIRFFGGIPRSANPPHRQVG